MAEELPSERDRAAAPGMPRWLKAILLVVIIAVAVVVLFTWVFPWVEEMTQNPTMGTTSPVLRGVPFLRG